MSSLRIRKLLPDLFSKKKKMLQLNIIRCESHKDILVNVMQKAVKKRN
jgi:poly-gamma-glutamate synthesis protein (capsule biosynthesis protein)